MLNLFDACKMVWIFKKHNFVIFLISEWWKEYFGKLLFFFYGFVNLLLCNLQQVKVIYHLTSDEVDIQWFAFLISCSFMDVKSNKNGR